MSPSEKRVKRPLTAIARLIRSSKRMVSTPCVDIRVAKNVRQCGQLVIVVPRRTGNAVKRNLFKRRIRALMRERGSCVHLYDWIFFARTTIGSCSYAQLSNAVEEAFHKLSKSSLSSSSSD